MQPPLFRRATWVIGAMVTVCMSDPTAGQNLGSWQTKADLPVPILEGWAGELDGEIYVVGGFTSPSEATSTVQRYNIEMDRWEILNPFPATRELTHVGLANAGGRLFAIGGLDRSFVPSDTVYEYLPETDHWAPRTPLPDPRGAFGICVVDNQIYCSGGFPPESRGRDFARYDPVLDEWEDLPDLLTARESHVSVAIDGKIYLFGGRVRSLNAFVTSTEVFDPETSEWRTLSPIPTPRGGLAGATIGGRAYVMGGERSANLQYPQGVHGEVEEYDPLRDRWRPVSTMPFPRHGMVAVPYEGKIYVPGGGPIVAFSESVRLDCFTPPPARDFSGIRVK